MILRLRREAIPIEPGMNINPRLLELQTAKEILAEIFHARPAEVKEMIQSRLEERSWEAERMPIYGELWPEAFCLGE